MSTRSFIAISNENGTIQGIYCHQNGSPRHNGQMLLNHYDSSEKLNELFKKGSLSILAETPDTCTLSPNSKRGIQTTTFETWMQDIQADLDYIYIFYPARSLWQCLNTDDLLLCSISYAQKVEKLDEIFPEKTKNNLTSNLMLQNTIIYYTRIFNVRTKSIHEKINGRSYLEFALQSEGKRLNTITRAQRAEHLQNSITH